MRRYRTGSATLGLSVLVLAGCRVFDESLLTDGGRDAGRDAGADAGEDAAAIDSGFDGGPACPLRRPPARPEIADSADGEVVVFALDAINLDQRDQWATIGYDVDGLCTTVASPMVECQPPSPSESVEIDGEGGIDNVLGHEILPLVLGTMPDLEDQSLADMHKGIGAVVVKITGWNGMPDDPRVDVVVAQSVFGTPALPDGGMPDPAIPDGGIVYDEGGVPPLPAWDGRDWWWVRVETFLDGNPDRPMIRDDNAYVADDTIVLHLPDRVPVILSGTVRAAIIRLTDATLTLTMSADHQTIDPAILSGRWPLSDILRDIEHANVCRDSDFYRTFAHLLDLTADVRAIPGSGGGSATCDAISVATSFTGVRAHFGGLSDLFRIPSPCERDAGMGMDGG